MNVAPTLSFKLALAVIVLLEITGDVTQIKWLHYGCKPLIMGLLLLYVRSVHRNVTYTTSMRWLLTGMVFALAGDVFLMIQEGDLFAAGLGAFLIMQVCYSTAFLRSIRQSAHTISTRSFLLKTIPFLIYVVSFLGILRPVFTASSVLSTMWWPVVLYAICLGTMGTLSTQRSGLPYSSQIITGALLFIFSDSVIAINKFLVPLTGAPWLIMPTYAAAQYLIVTGVTRATLTPQESGLSG